MASTLYKTFEWTTEAPADTILTVMRALEPQLVSGTSTIPRLESQGYYLSSPKESMQGLTPDELTEVGPQLEAIDALRITYANYSGITEDELYTFNLRLTNYLSDTVQVGLNITAPRTNEAFGMIEKLQQRINTEINRQDKSAWQAPPLEITTPPPSPDTLTSSAPVKRTGLTKQEKPRVVKKKLRRGPILQSELISLLEIAEANAKSIRMSVKWKGDDEATVRSVSEIDPIEDPAGVKTITANFGFDDRSTLRINFDREFDFELEATGQVARQRLSAIEHYWATIPGRGRLSTMFIYCSSFGASYLVAYGFLFLVYAIFAKSFTLALIWTAVLLAIACIVAYLWSTPSGRARFKMIIPVRRRIDGLKLVSAIAGCVAAIVAILAYLFPLK